jgi:hypothetical protein
MVEAQNPIWHEEYGLTLQAALDQAREAYRRRAKDLVQMNVLLHEKLRDRIRAHCEKKGLTISDFVAEALAKGVRRKG